ncbi:lysophospholipid acyltransferase family protein [Oxobacter pfennigii]|uniref:lysophospholipid acyltransferase family protein n=1 Tax=Oxobacter pfennigii TaxID=36849 RepID=UPI001FA6D02D|nr:lysophospholipid acyltransferase family protein [Oxobacter pfennigii]
MWFILFWLYQIYLIPKLIYAYILNKNNKIKERDSFVYGVAGRWARFLVKMTGSTVKVIGEENIPHNSPVVFIGNHQGNFDIPIYLGYINKPKAFISKIEIKKIPFISTWMKYMNCIFMERDDVRQSLKAINEGVEYIKQGYSYVIFPEGSRSKGDNINEFKTGSFKLALKAEVPIVPVTMKGSYKIMEKNGFFITPAYIEVIISPAIETAGMSKEDARNIQDKVKNIISSNL